MSHIGTRIKQQREALGLTQEELALKLGYKSKSTINKIEMGKNDITQTKIELFAKALNTTPAHLMGFNNEFDRLIGKNIKHFRENKKMSQQELGNLIDKPVNSVQDYENGITHAPFNILMAISNALGINVNDLINSFVFQFEPSKEIHSVKNLEDYTREYWYSFDDIERNTLLQIIDNFAQLNFNGHNKLIDFSDMLIKIPEYRKNTDE